MPVTTSADSNLPSDPPPGQSASIPDRVAMRMEMRARRSAPSGRWSDWLLDLADRKRGWIFLFILLLYAAGFNGQWRVEPDSGLYLSIGRNLAEGHGYTFHGKDHRLAYPGVPLFFFAVFKTFGTGSFLPHLIAMWLMGLATLMLVYRLFLLHAGRPTAVLITLGVAVSRVFYRYSFELLTDLPFLLGVMAFFVGYEAIFYRRSLRLSENGRTGTAEVRWYDGVLLVLGLAFAVASRPAMWALVAAAGLSAIWSFFGRARWAHLIVVALVVLIVGFFYLQDPRQQHGAGMGPSYAEEDELFKLNTETWSRRASLAMRNAQGVLEHSIERAGFGTPVLPVFNSVLSLALLASAISLLRVRPLWAMWVLATTLMVLIVPHPLDRYFLPVVPIFVYSWWRLIRMVEIRLKGRAAGVVFFLLFGLGAVPNMLELFGFVAEQRQPRFLLNYKKGRYATNDQVVKMIESNTAASTSPTNPQTTWVLVGSKFGRAMTLLSRRYCVEPDETTQLDPVHQSLYLLEPSEPLNPEQESRHRESELPRRGTPRQWMEARQLSAVGPIQSIPNRDPDDPRPWQLFKVVPKMLPPAPTPVPLPASPGPATGPASKPASPPSDTSQSK